MKKIVIAGSATLQTEYKEFISNLGSNYKVLNYPQPIKQEELMEKYPEIHKKFFEDIINADIFLLFNYDKKCVSGYIGAEGFAELCFALSQNLLYNKSIELYIYKMPDKSVQSYDEIKRWLELGWIKIWDK